MSAGRSTWSISVTVRVHQDFQKSLADIEHGSTGGGDLAKFLLFIGYTIRS
jgi:hypothetical protein